MLTHDHLIHAIVKDTGLVHGQDFYVVHPIDDVTGKQSGDPYIMTWSRSDIPQPNVEKILKKYDAVYAKSFEENRVRSIRNHLLSQTDWTQLSDVPKATRDKYSAYRKALRDLPQQGGFPMNMAWPAAPS